MGHLMQVLGAVPPAQLLALRRAGAGRFEFVPAGTWDEALEAIRSRPVELAVVDPLLRGEPRTTEIERLRLLFPSLPLILYTTFTPPLAPVLLALGQRGIRSVVCTRFDDHPEQLRRLLEQEGLRASSQRVLAELSEALSPLPAAVRRILEDALRAPDDVQTVQQLAKRADVDRRTCSRWFLRLGLPAPRHLLAAARVLYAHRLLQDPGFTIEDVARRLGYARVKTLQRHAHTFLGLTAGEMRLSLSTDEALRLVAGRFLERGLRLEATA